MRAQIIVFLAYTVSSTLSFAADGPGYIGNRFPGVVEPLIEWRKTTLPLPYNQHVRKQRRLRISIQHGIRPSNRGPSNQFAQRQQVATPVFAQPPSRSTEAPKNVDELQKGVGTSQQPDLTRSMDQVAEFERVKAEPSDIVELSQTIQTLQTELTRSTAKIQDLVKAKSESRDVIEKLQADLLRSADQVVDLEKAKAQLELSAKQAEQARDTAENDKHQTEQVSNKKSTKLSNGLHAAADG